MNKVTFFLITLLLPFPLLASEIQHVLGGVYEILTVAVILLIVLFGVLPIAYYRTRKKTLAYLLYVVGGLAFCIGLLIVMAGSSTAVIIGVIFFAIGTLLIRMPMKRKPL